nr:MAG TPA: hypothetical protein [Caudoviricetes sp.]
MGLTNCGRGCQSLFFVCIGLNLLDSQANYVAFCLVQLFTAVVQILNCLLICSDFKLDVFRVFSLWPACTGRHLLTTFLVYTDIITCTRKRRNPAFFTNFRLKNCAKRQCTKEKNGILPFAIDICFHSF